MIIFKYIKETENEVFYNFFLETEKKLGGVVAFKRGTDSWRYVKKEIDVYSSYTVMILQAAKK